MLLHTSILSSSLSHVCTLHSADSFVAIEEHKIQTMKRQKIYFELTIRFGNGVCLYELVVATNFVGDLTHITYTYTYIGKFFFMNIMNAFSFSFNSFLNFYSNHVGSEDSKI